TALSASGGARRAAGRAIAGRRRMRMSLSYKTVPSPVGELKLVASDKGLTAILWECDRDTDRVKLGAMAEDDGHPVLIEAARQIGEYFDGRRTAFDVPLDFRGTEFQRSVWAALLTIPFG